MVGGRDMGVGADDQAGAAIGEMPGNGKCTLISPTMHVWPAGVIVERLTARCRDPMVPSAWDLRPEKSLLWSLLVPTAERQVMGRTSVTVVPDPLLCTAKSPPTSAARCFRLVRPIPVYSPSTSKPRP